MTASPPPSNRPPAAPSYLLDGRYLCVEPLSRGETTTSYAGSDTWSGEQVCVRLLRADRRDAESSFRRMSERMFGLTSARFVRPIAFGNARGGLPFLVTELIVGRSVEKLARVRWEVAVEVVRHGALAISEMHLHGLVHGSLRPSSLFVVASAQAGSRVKLVDLGRGDPGPTEADDCRALAQILIRLLAGPEKSGSGPIEVEGAPAELTVELARWTSTRTTPAASEIAATLRDLLDPEGVASAEPPSTSGEVLVLPKSDPRIG